MSHEEILNLPICTLRQKLAVVEMRTRNTRLYNEQIAEWQTRTIAQFIAASVPLSKGQKNPLADAAAKIRLRMETEAGTSESDVPMEEWLEKGSQVAMNSNGSFERLMAGFGGGG